MYANGSRTQPFVVIKGYHMGSAWFEEAFNKLRGVSFFFEYEHCLRDLAPAGSHLASAMLTFRHLQQSCGSCTDQQRTTRCRACGVVPPPIGSTLHRTSAGSNVQWPAAAPSEAPCVATGISFAAVGPVYMQHLLALRQPDTGDLRIREDGARHDIVTGRAQVVGVEEVVLHDPALPVRDVLELEGVGDVAQRPHAVSRGALVLVDHDQASGTHLDTRVVETQVVGVGDAAGGDEDQIDVDAGVVGQVGTDGAVVVL